MHQLSRVFLVLGSFSSLLACGGGGGSASSASATGSGIFQNFTASSTVNNICRNYNVPTDSTACSSAGGTWTSRNTYTTAAGSIDYNTYTEVCSSGTASTKCNLSGVAFTPTAGLSISSVAACEQAQGTVDVTCSTVSGTEDFCNISAPTNATDCTSLGGTFYSSLSSVTGSVNSEQFVAGNNILQVIIDYPAVDAVDVMALNPQSPVYFTYTLRLKNSGTTFWTSAQSRDTGAEFGESEGNSTFSVESPIAADETSVFIDTGTLFFE